MTFVTPFWFALSSILNLLIIKMIFQKLFNFLERLFFRIGHGFFLLQIFHKVIDSRRKGDVFDIKGKKALLRMIKYNRRVLPGDGSNAKVFWNLKVIGSKNAWVIDSGLRQRDDALQQILDFFLI